VRSSSAATAPSVPGPRDVAPRDYSEEVAALVDEEVKKLIETAHNEAWEILVENRDVLDNLVSRCWRRKR